MTICKNIVICHKAALITPASSSFLSEFKRAFTLPENMKTEDVTSSLSEDGILKIEGVRDVKPAITDVPILVEHSSTD
ncbi:unnamed protein product [Clavelina lepadiformis]|uniref:SHSP domain-containing protein n=1 Tax=Clavelina lepadiformis TaxID=159417 RepID=A0ABP0G5D8_CLALP